MERTTRKVQIAFAVIAFAAIFAVCAFPMESCLAYEEPHDYVEGDAIMVEVFWDTDTSSPTYKVYGCNYINVTNLLGYGADYMVVTLMKDCGADKGWTFPQCPMFLDLNGHTLTLGKYEILAHENPVYLINHDGGSVICDTDIDFIPVDYKPIPI